MICVCSLAYRHEGQRRDADKARAVAAPYGLAEFATGHAARASSGCGYMSGRHWWRSIPVAFSARRTYSAGNGWPLRIQFETFCCDVPIAAANFDWLLSKGCAAMARAMG